jgi:Tol biopolymer transport system component
MKKCIVPFCWLFLLSTAVAQSPVGVFENSTDIGNPKMSGSSEYNAQDQSYSIKGGGYNIWFGRDEFHYDYSQITGDFILTANFSFQGTGVDPHRKVGWMIRESLDDDAAHISATLHGDGLTVLQWRTLKGAHMRDPQDEIFATKASYPILQLERNGNHIIMRAAQIGEPLQLIGKQKMSDLPDEVFAGLFVCSHNEDVLEEAKVWNVRIDKPVADDYNPNQEGWLSSRLEVLNVFDGTRKVIHTHDGRFEAPNWMPTGDKLLFNQDGSLYTIGLDGQNVSKVNTGFANRNNNDHGISFNGKLLAISHHRDGLAGGGSTVYVLPLDGGEPQQVTEKTPSYWHGWAPNNKEVVYVAQRDADNYDIYKKSISGGEEIKLTENTNSHADGPEYSPDGKYIYYNASTTGTMQIWRMKPDGSQKEQITFDEYNDWFPHISPDGKWIAFISFPVHIDPKSHPTYKRVMLRLMPATGGTPIAIAYLFGGQGTINVPSWSPDSKSIAFVSYSR